MANISRADLNLFVVFEAIHAHGGVTRAAEALNLSQPAISHALARLREQVGDPLFVRAGRRLAPTPAAQAMIGPVREALRLFEGALGPQAGFDPGASSRSFSIGMRALMESANLHPLALRLRRLAPGVALVSRGYDRRRLAPLLASGELDAAVDVFLPLPPEVKRLRLSRARAVVALRRGHPAAAGGLDLETYLRGEHVLVSSRPHGGGPEDVALARIGRARRIALRCQEVTAALAMVAQTDLMLTMSETLARRAAGWFDGPTPPVPFAAAELDTYLYWHENADHDPAGQWFRQVALDAAAEGEAAG